MTLYVGKKGRSAERNRILKGFKTKTNDLFVFWCDVYKRHPNTSFPDVRHLDLCRDRLIFGRQLHGQVEHFSEFKSRGWFHFQKSPAHTDIRYFKHPLDALDTGRTVKLKAGVSPVILANIRNRPAKIHPRLWTLLPGLWIVVVFLIIHQDNTNGKTIFRKTPVLHTPKYG